MTLDELFNNAKTQDAGYEDGHVSHRKNGDFIKQGGSWVPMKGQKQEGAEKSEAGTDEQTMRQSLINFMTKGAPHATEADAKKAVENLDPETLNQMFEGLKEEKQLQGKLKKLDKAPAAGPKKNDPAAEQTARNEAMKAAENESQNAAVFNDLNEKAATEGIEYKIRKTKAGEYYWDKYRDGKHVGGGTARDKTDAINRANKNFDEYIKENKKSAGSTGSSGVKRPSEAEVTKMRKEKAELDEKSDAIWHERINLTLNSSDKEMESRGAKLIDSREFGTDGINKTYELPNGDRYDQMYKKTNGNYLGGSLHRADKNPEWRGSWKPGDTSVLKHTEPNVYRDNVTLNTVNEYMELFGYKPIGQKTNPGSWEGTIKVYETPEGKIEEKSFNKNGEYAGGSIHYKEDYEYERLDKNTGDAAPLITAQSVNGPREKMERKLTGDCKVKLSKIKK